MFGRSSNTTRESDHPGDVDAADVVDAADAADDSVAPPNAPDRPAEDGAERHGTGWIGRDDAMLDALRILRGFLSVAAVVLVVFQPDDEGAELGTPLVLFVCALALLNLATALGARRSVGLRSIIVERWSIGQIVVDIVLALSIMLVVDMTATPLLWVALLVPVFDAAESHRAGGAMITWIFISALHIALQLQLVDPDSSSGGLMRIAIQQVVAVGAIVVPAAVVANRLRVDVAAAGSARLSADERTEQLRRLSRAGESMTGARRPRDVLVRAAMAGTGLGMDRVDISHRRPGQRWNLVVADGAPTTLDPNDDPVLLELSPGSIEIERVGDGVEINTRLTTDGFLARAVGSFTADDGSTIAVRAFMLTVPEPNAPRLESFGLLLQTTRAAWNSTVMYENLAKWSQQLAHDANHDALTDLPNRGRLFELLAETDISKACLLFLDLDGFKAVNDSIGHDAGDDVLITVAERLNEVIGDDDVAARLGGDEFIVLARPSDLSRAQSLAMDVIDAITRPIDLGDTSADIGTSVGIAVGQPGESADDLVRRADQAMYSAKATGGRAYHVADVDGPDPSTRSSRARRR